MSEDVNTNVSGSIDNNYIIDSSSNAVIQHKKVVGRPFKKGVSGNPKGKPKGTIQIKDLLRKKLNKKDAELIVDNIISGSIQGFDAKQDRLLKLTGDFDNKLPTQQVNILNNNAIITTEALEWAKEFLKKKDIEIIDIKEIKDKE